jgi:hypothetical protein
MKRREIEKITNVNFLLQNRAILIKKARPTIRARSDLAELTRLELATSRVTGGCPTADKKIMLVFIQAPPCRRGLVSPP